MMLDGMFLAYIIHVTITHDGLGISTYEALTIVAGSMLLGGSFKFVYSSNIQVYLVCVKDHVYCTP